MPGFVTRPGDYQRSWPLRMMGSRSAWIPIECTSSVRSFGEPVNCPASNPPGNVIELTRTNQTCRPRVRRVCLLAQGEGPHVDDPGLHEGLGERLGGVGREPCRPGAEPERQPLRDHEVVGRADREHAVVVGLVGFLLIPAITDGHVQAALVAVDRLRRADGEAQTAEAGQPGLRLLEHPRHREPLQQRRTLDVFREVDAVGPRRFLGAIGPRELRVGVVAPAERLEEQLARVVTRRFALVFRRGVGLPQERVGHVGGHDASTRELEPGR